jgi:hypothetical protein
VTHALKVFLDCGFGLLNKIASEIPAGKNIFVRLFPAKYFPNILFIILIRGHPLWFLVLKNITKHYCSTGAPNDYGNQRQIERSRQKYLLLQAKLLKIFSFLLICI